MARSRGVSLNLDGFEAMLADIEKAGASVNKAAEKCIKASADIVDDEMKRQMRKAGVDSGLISRLPPAQIKSDGNRFEADTGYKKGAYDPHNLSDGYKAVFLNYGTPRRKSHGKERARGFVQATKKSAARKVKKVQAATLEEILKGLKK